MITLFKFFSIIFEENFFLRILSLKKTKSLFLFISILNLIYLILSFLSILKYIC